MNIEKLLSDFDPLLIKLSRYPFQIGNKRPVDEKKQAYIYEELQIKFIELCQEYDESRGRLPAYIKGHLQWFAHHIIERMKLEDDKLKLVDPEILEETIPNPEIPEIDFSDEISFHMEHLISRLPNRQRRVVYEHYVLGFDMKHIAENMGLNISNVYNYRQIGIDRLRELYTKKEES